eukprot:GHVQ01022148.1.p1 GENE.GHVQ01022148.1~~GHVQ01022148.1.p1  ORF type:complete len:125 (+),score=14.71 GHVQ01022148.1:802-1176(+)
MKAEALSYSLDTNRTEHAKELEDVVKSRDAAVAAHEILHGLALDSCEITLPSLLQTKTCSKLLTTENLQEEVVAVMAVRDNTVGIVRYDLKRQKRKLSQRPSSRKKMTLSSRIAVRNNSFVLVV